MTERIQRIFVVDSHGDQQTLAFDLDRFVSYNVDTRCLTLTNGMHYVHPSSEDNLIKAYRDYYRTYSEEIRELEEKLYPTKEKDSDANSDNDITDVARNFAKAYYAAETRRFLLERYFKKGYLDISDLNDFWQQMEDKDIKVIEP